jgi:P2 family phage contractile tail tube protein
MGLPKKLKNFDVFQNGESWIGQVNSVTLPKLTRKIEEWRGAGMAGDIGIDVGQEKLELALSAGGMLRSALRTYGIAAVNGVMLRFAGAYQAEDTGSYDAVEVVVRGRYTELDFGDSKTGADTEHKYNFRATFYKLSVNGIVEIEIDILNSVFVVGGVDRLAAERRAMGHW